MVILHENLYLIGIVGIGRRPDDVPSADGEMNGGVTYCRCQDVGDRGRYTATTLGIFAVHESFAAFCIVLCCTYIWRSYQSVPARLTYWYIYLENLHRCRRREQA